MRAYKYSIWVITVIVGSEVIFKCLKHLYNMLHHKSSDPVKSPQSSFGVKRQRTVNKVIFFPDRGILSRLTAGDTSNRQDMLQMEGSLGNQRQDPRGKSHLPGHVRGPFSLDENRLPRSVYLKRSTSLIHLVDALDSARCSLKVCVYVITLQDLVDAMVRAKNRGVYVRVMVEGQMPNEAALTTLRKNNIPARVSHSSRLLHHKFALMDAPDLHHQAVIPGNAAPTGIQIKGWMSRLNDYLFCGSSPSQSALAAGDVQPLLLTGSFNWTWTAVINNHENAIISSDSHLIHDYNEEFHRLWKTLEAS